MRYEMKKIIAACMTGVTVFAMVPMQSQAANANAGITAVLGESLSSGISAGVTAGNTQNTTAANVNTICGYTNLGIANVDNHLNIREGAGEDFDLAGKLPKDAACEILGAEGEWSQIQSGDVTGYVKTEFLLTGDAAVQKAAEVKSIVAVSNTTTLNARTEPNTECSIWTTIAEGEELQVLEDMGDWVI